MMMPTTTAAAPPTTTKTTTNNPILLTISLDTGTVKCNGPLNQFPVHIAV